MLSQNKKELNGTSNNGVVVFILGLLLASFFGGAVRTLVSPQQVQLYIQRQVEARKPKFDLNFQKAELTLARGWWPRMGLQLSGLQLTSQDLCRSPIRFEVDQVYVPLDLWRFAQGQLKFLNIEFGHVRLVKQVSECPTTGAPVEMASIPPKSTITKEIGETSFLEIESRTSFDLELEKAQNFINTRWEKELANTKQWLKGVTAESLTFVSFGQRLQSHVFKNVRLQVRGERDPLALEFEYTPDSEVVYHQPLHDLRVMLELDREALQFEGRSGYKEGLLQFSGQWSLQSGEFQARSFIKNVPVAEIFQGFSKRNILPHVEPHRPIWFSCEQKLTGVLKKWAESELQLNNCLISGELGMIRLSHAELYPFSRPVRYQPLLIQLSRFSFENLFKAFNRVPPREMVHQLGTITGDLTVTSPQDVRFNGALNNLTLVFSVTNRREFQVFENITGELAFADSRFSGLISSAEVKDGVFNGKVSFNLDEKFTSGLFQTEIAKLQLQPTVRELIFLGGAPHLEIYGQGEIVDAKMNSWTGSFGIPSYQSNELELGPTKFQAQWKNNEWQGLMTSQNAQFLKASPFFSVLNPLYLEENPRDDRVHWRQLTAKILFGAKGFRWERASSRDLTKDIVFSSQGSWTLDEGVKGMVTVDFPVLKLLKWELEGPLESPRLSPSPKMLKELAQKRPDMSAPSMIDLSSSRLFFPSGFRSQAPKIRQVSDKALGKIKDTVLDSAKKLLPPKNDKEKPKNSTQEL